MNKLFYFKQYYPILVCFSFLICFAAPKASSQEWRTTVITDPSISSRCESLAKKRLETVDHKQKLQGLNLRTLNLINRMPKNRITLRRDVENTRSKVINELELIRLRIQNLEEHIVRQGCPGIRL